MLVKNRSFYILIDIGEIVISFILAIFSRYPVVQNGRFRTDGSDAC